MYIISGSTHQRLGASLAEEMDAEFCGVVNRHFPDGERYIRVLMDINENRDFNKRSGKLFFKDKNPKNHGRTLIS